MGLAKATLCGMGFHYMLRKVRFKFKSHLIKVTSLTLLFLLCDTKLLNGE
ncbi:hypothetical protein [Silvanigrella sp.]